MNCRAGLLSLFASACFFSNARAQVDQEHWHPNRVSGGVSGLGLQQEFTPEFDAMDSVELWIPEPILNPGGWYQAGSAAVNVRQGGIEGPVIATSIPFYNPPYYEGSAVFRFSEPVGLIPGQLYSLEPFHISGGGGTFAVSDLTGTFGYPGGQMFFNGSFGGDLIFREGLGIPEPRPLLLVAVGGISVLALRLTRRVSAMAAFRQT